VCIKRVGANRLDVLGDASDDVLSLPDSGVHGLAPGGNGNELGETNSVSPFNDMAFGFLML